MEEAFAAATRENAEAKVETEIGRMSMRTWFVPLYERQVAKPLSICNPDRDAFASRFTDGARCSGGAYKEKREKEGYVLSL